MKVKLLAALIATVALPLFAQHQAQAASVSFYPSATTDNGKDPVPTVKVTLDDSIGGGKIEVKVEVIKEGSKPILADINGIFLNFTGGLPSGLSYSGTNVTSAGNLKLKGGSNEEYQVAIPIGTAGMGEDDIQSTTVILSAAGPLTLDMLKDQSVGIRATSIGVAGDREYSAKLGGTVPAAPIEQPKAEEPKAEEPKAEEPKAEEPKAEEPKAEEPKAEEPKAEEPKAEEPKAGQPEEPMNPVEVPEPSSIAGLALGFGALMKLRNKKNAQKQ